MVQKRLEDFILGERWGALRWWIVGGREWWIVLSVAPGDAVRSPKNRRRSIGSPYKLLHFTAEISAMQLRTCPSLSIWGGDLITSFHDQKFLEGGDLITSFHDQKSVEGS